MREAIRERMVATLSMIRPCCIAICLSNAIRLAFSKVTSKAIVALSSSILPSRVMAASKEEAKSVPISMGVSS